MLKAQPMADKKLFNSVRSGDLRSVARAISWVEDDDPRAAELIDQLFPESGKAEIIGVTGSPGAGKSTLVDRLAREYHSTGKKVAILAVDPSSPFTGGAVLGDRIRMATASELDGVYIRSMASRGALGGVAPHTAEAIFVLDAAGFDTIIVETVGVGQAEVEIVRMADAVVVVLVPGMGDTVQALKAGILEIADLFAINKADYPAVDKLERELMGVLALAPASAHKPEIIRTVASEGKGATELVAALVRFREASKESGSSEKRREIFLENTLNLEIAAQAVRGVREKDSTEYVEAVGMVRQRKISPRTAALKLLAGK